MASLSVIQPHNCGTCTYCCKLLGVLNLKQPNVWCDHCDIGKGCIIYDKRPSDCVEFECLWLIIQDMPDSMRPDRCKVVMSSTKDGESVVVFVDPVYASILSKDNLLKSEIGRYIDKLVQKGLVIMVVAGEHRNIYYKGSKVPEHLREALNKLSRLPDNV